MFKGYLAVLFKIREEWNGLFSEPSRKVTCVVRHPGGQTKRRKRATDRQACESMGERLTHRLVPIQIKGASFVPSEKASVGLAVSVV